MKAREIASRARCGPRVRVVRRDALEQDVGIGLEPHDFPEPGGLRWLDTERPSVHLGPPPSRSQHVQAAIGGDAVEPGAHRGAGLEGREALPGGQQRLLQRVLGVLDRAEQPVAMHLDLAPVRIHQLCEGDVVARMCPGDQVCHRVSILPSPLPPDHRPHRYRHRHARKWAPAAQIADERGVSTCDIAAPARSGPTRGADDAEKYVFAYRAPKDYVPGRPEAIKTWTEFRTGLGDRVVDFGNPVFEASTVGTLRRPHPPRRLLVHHRGRPRVRGGAGEGFAHPRCRRRRRGGGDHRTGVRRGRHVRGLESSPTGAADVSRERRSRENVRPELVPRTAPM